MRPASAPKAEDSPATKCTVLRPKEQANTPREASTHRETSTREEAPSTQQEVLSTQEAQERASTEVEASTVPVAVPSTAPVVVVMVASTAGDQDSTRVAQGRTLEALTKAEDLTAAVTTFLRRPTAPTDPKTEASDAYPNVSPRKEPR